jgi:diguanylate cyclase (GGDEF)-like protein
MEMQRAAIYSDSDELRHRLSVACPQWTLLTVDPERETCRLAVVDGPGRPPGKSIVRLHLSTEIEGEERKSGELYVPRDIFLSAPLSYLDFAAEMVNAVLHAARLEREAAYLRQIHELMTFTEEEDVSRRITLTLLDLLGLEHGTLFLHDPRIERYVVSFSNDPETTESAEFLPGVPPPLLHQALAAPERFAVRRGENGAGMMVVPLQVREDLLGVIRLSLAPSYRLDEEAAAGVTSYLEAVSQVLSNIYQLTRNRDLALRDDLTKAYNRRFLDIYLDEEIDRSRRYGALLSIIFLDLDDLKAVNDKYGHLSGSRTLQEAAKRILAAVRGIDKVVRFGGDEFCVILPQTPEDQAVAVAQRVARAISASPLRVDTDVEVTITASFGIATWPVHALTRESLIHQADAAMYRVKSSTKNAVGVAEVYDATPPVH